MHFLVPTEALLGPLKVDLMSSHRIPINHRETTASSQALSTRHSTGHGSEHPQQRYLIDPKSSQPFFAPEGESTRVKRLNNELDILMTTIQFSENQSREARSVRSPSHELIRQLNPPAHLADERSKMQKKQRMVEMDRALTHVRGSSKNGKKGTKVTREDERSC